MYNRTFRDNNGNEWARVDKRRARNLYNNGVTICICPDNLRPFGMWSPEFIFNKADKAETYFNDICNYFKIYNCTTRETGYNIAFYIKGVE